ncbi:AgmX/PglI C-terminal domain-containing protein (plasmid) [Sorangium sp. So ce119]|uniref:AgmX/PglI C-terminal domain-containing protein n=1 Tax=Sorangium sp. So ce119 TaxID=3133279 RepID=UPI003F638A48
MNIIHHPAVAAVIAAGLLSLASCTEGPETAAPGAEARVDLVDGADRRPDISLAIEQAERRLDAGREIAAARRALSDVLAEPSVTPDQRDQARLAMSRVLEAEGDQEAAIAAVESLLGDHVVGEPWPLQRAAERRLRLLVTGSEEKPLPEEPSGPERASPFARALARYFPVPESGPRELTVTVLAFGGSREVSERLGTFAVARAIRAIRREACPRCDDQVAINNMSHGTDGWAQIPASRPLLGSSLAVFYFDLGNQRIPARYDADLPLPTADIVARLEKGEGLIAVRERGGAPPAILIAAPRQAQLPVVEEALAAMHELPAGPVAVPLPDGLTPAEIQAVVRGSFGRYRVCYEELLARSPAAAGSIPLTFAILGDGTVADAAVDTAKSTLRDATLERCMVAATSALTFPGIGKKTTVVYPIEFSPGD